MADLDKKDPRLNAWAEREIERERGEREGQALTRSLGLGGKPKKMEHGCF